MSSLPWRLALAERLVLGFVGGVPGLALLERQAAGGPEFQVAGVHRLGDGHVLLFDGGGPALVTLEQRLRLGNRAVVVHRQVLRARLPTPVRRLVLVHEQERLAGVALVLEPPERQVRDDVGGVAGVLDASLALLDHGGIVVRALANEDFVVVEPLRVLLVAQVVLADDRRLVAGLLEEFGERLLVLLELDAVPIHAVQVAVLAREDDGPHRPADGVGDVALVEAHAFAGKAVDVGRLVDLRPVRADGLVRVVVAVDEEDVRPLGGRRGNVAGFGGNQKGGGEERRGGAAGRLLQKLATRTDGHDGSPFESAVAAIKLHAPGARINAAKRREA